MIPEDSTSQASSAYAGASQAANAARAPVSLVPPVTGNQMLMSGLLYALGSVLAFGLLGLAAICSSDGRSTASLTLTLGLLEGALLLLGPLYTAMLPRWLRWHDAMRHWPGALILGLTALVGAVVIWALRWVPWTQHAHWPTARYAVAVVAFLAPYFFWHAYQAWLALSAVEYKLWYYNPRVASFDESRIDLSQYIAVNFQLTRRYGQPQTESLFASNAPVQMPFWQVFDTTITEYNRQNPGQTVEHTDGRQQPYGWFFYAKHATWWRRRHYFDPDLTTADNALQQGDMIFAERVPMPDKPMVGT